MNARLRTFILGTLLHLGWPGVILAQNEPEPIQAPATPAAVPDESDADAPAAAAGKLGMYEFQGDEPGLVLRTLARQAKLNLVVSDKVTSSRDTVTMRIQNKTPREVIEIIVMSKGWVMDELDGIIFIKTGEERVKEPPSRHLARITETVVEPLARLKGEYFRHLVASGVPAETAADLVAREELSKAAFGATAAAPGSASSSTPTRTSLFQLGEASDWLIPGMLSAAILGNIPIALLHVTFAFAVWFTARRVERVGEPLTFLGSFMWALATLIGGIFVAALYWLIHHSTLRRPPAA